MITTTYSIALDFHVENAIFIVPLIADALKFTKKNVPVILTIKGSKLTEEKKVNFPSLSKGREYYELLFIDNGIGFDAEYAEKIFTLFQRLNKDGDYAGYGVGLALCSKVVSYHQGFIRAESVVNQGASFTIILPYSQN